MASKILQLYKVELSRYTIKFMLSLLLLCSPEEFPIGTETVDISWDVNYAVFFFHPARAYKGTL